MRQQFNLHLSPRRTITAWNRHFISMECNAWTSQKGHIRRLDLHESVTSSSPLEACAVVGRSKYEGKSRCLSVSVTAGICTSSSAPFVIFAESSAYCTWMTTQHVHHNAPYHQHARACAGTLWMSALAGQRTLTDRV